MNYAKIMESGTVRISSIKKEGYKPLKEEKPEGFSNLVFVGYTETEENVIKEYEAVDDGMSAYGKLQKDLKATQAAQEDTDQAAQFLANRIKGGHLTIDNVPESLKEQVQALL